MGFIDKIKSKIDRALVKRNKAFQICKVRDGRFVVLEAGMGSGMSIVEPPADIYPANTSLEKLTDDLSRKIRSPRIRKSKQSYKESSSEKPILGWLLKATGYKSATDFHRGMKSIWLSKSFKKGIVTVYNTKVTSARYWGASFEPPVAEVKLRDTRGLLKAIKKGLDRAEVYTDS